VASYGANLLVQELLIAKRDLKLSRVLKRLSGYEVLMVDDLGLARVPGLATLPKGNGAVPVGTHGTNLAYPIAMPDVDRSSQRRTCCSTLFRSPSPTARCQLGANRVSPTTALGGATARDYSPADDVWELLQ
jgi:hypothetical protein